MGKDRLPELKKSIKRADVLYNEIPQQDVRAEQSTTLQLESPILQPEFLEEFNEIRLETERIEKWINEIKRIHLRLLEPLPDPNLRKTLDEQKSLIMVTSDRISNKLKELETRQKRTNPQSISPAQWRMQESQILDATRSLRNTMNHFHQETLRYRDRCKIAIKRELELAGSRRSEDELEEIIEKGVPGLYNFSLLHDVEKARESLSMIEARDEDILKLERSVQQAVEMFRDMERLVVDQGGMIDSIEHSVGQTHESVIRGNAKIQAAVEEKATTVKIAGEEKKKKSMKRKVWIIVIIVAILAGLLLVSVLSSIIQRIIFG